MNIEKSYLRLIPKPDVAYIHVKDVTLIYRPHCYVPDVDRRCKTCQMLAITGEQKSLYSEEQHIEESALILGVDTRIPGFLKGLKDYIERITETLKDLKIDKVICESL